MDILVAKRSLYKTLKTNAEVIGAGIKEHNGTEYIVIFLSKTTKSLLEKVPHEYLGYKVTIEIIGEVNAQ